MFEFFLQGYRKGLLTFSGTVVDDIHYKEDGDDCLITFKKFDNGLYKDKPIYTKHPNIVYGVIKGKKSWGLWLGQWTDGIVDWTFTVEEIENEFKQHGIEIPEPLWKDFNNVLTNKKKKRWTI